MRVCDSKLSITWKSANTPAEIIKAVPCFTKPVPATTLMPTYPTQGAPGSPTFGVPTADPMTTETFPPPQGTDSPPGSGSGSSLPWPTSYPHWLTTVNYEDMFTQVEDVLIWGGGDRLDQDRAVFSLRDYLPGFGYLAALSKTLQITSSHLMLISSP